MISWSLVIRLIRKITNLVTISDTSINCVTLNGENIFDMHAVATWHLGNHLSICLQTEENKVIQPVSRWPASSRTFRLRNDFYPAVRIAKDDNTTTCLSLYS